MAFLHNEEKCEEIFCWHFVRMVGGTGTKDFGTFRETNRGHLVQTMTMSGSVFWRNG